MESRELKKFFRVPIDVGQKLNSCDVLRYMWTNWRLIGMRPTKRFRHLYYAYAIFANLIFAVGLPVSMVIKLFYIEDLEKLVENLYLNINVIVCTSKQAAIYYYLNQLLETNTYLEKLDARCNPHRDDRRHILNGAFICMLFHVYLPFYVFLCTGFVINAFRVHDLPYSAWYPDLFENPETNYIIVYFYQCWAALFFIFQNANNDMYPPCYLMLLISHLRALSARIERIGRDSKMSVDENLEELVNCIKDHKDILELFDCVCPVISATIFLQFLTTAVVLCLSAINFIAFERDAVQLLFNASYLLAIIAESFPCCWLANVLMDETSYLTTAIYNCNWYEQNERFRKTMIIFRERSKITIEIIAGNMVPVTIETFVNVVKFAFSIYTLINEMQL